MTFEDHADLVRVISAERERVIHAGREKPAPALAYHAANGR